MFIELTLTFADSLGDRIEWRAGPRTLIQVDRIARFTETELGDLHMGDVPGAWFKQHGGSDRTHVLEDIDTIMQRLYSAGNFAELPRTIDG